MVEGKKMTYLHQSGVDFITRHRHKMQSLAVLPISNA